MFHELIVLLDLALFEKMRSPMLEVLFIRIQMVLFRSTQGQPCTLLHLIHCPILNLKKYIHGNSTLNYTL